MPDPADEFRLSPGQDRAALVLATGGTTKLAAAKANVSVRTVQKWKDLPGFQARVAALREETFRRAADRASGLMGRALVTLGRMLASANEPVRLGAAKAILAASVDLKAAVEAGRLVEELLRRVEELERWQQQP